MLHHIATISVCSGGHFESKITAKIQKSSDLGESWYYYRHDRVKNWGLVISYYVLTLFFIHTTSACIVPLGDICNALYLFLIKSRCVVLSLQYTILKFILEHTVDEIQFPLLNMIDR